jgi:hypothetical protein
MYRLGRQLAAITIFIAGGIVVTTAYMSRSGDSEGRPKGMKYASVVADLNSAEPEILDASRLFCLPPRSFGCAIAAERAMNFQPFLEDIGDAIFGTSVGLAQVSTIAFREMLTELYQNDSTIHFCIRRFDVVKARAYFRDAAAAKRYKRKLRLLLDTKFNITAAALIFRHSLDRYYAAAPRLNIFNRPDLAATLYHRTFPDTIKGIPDKVGLLALRFYNDTLFMPHSLLREEVTYGRRD